MVQKEHPEASRSWLELRRSEFRSNTAIIEATEVS